MMNVYGIDIGTSTLRIFLKGKGIIYNQRNVLSFIDKNKIIATGDEAWAMAEKAPSNIDIISPVRGGVLADIKNMTDMLDIVFEKLEEEHGKMLGQEFIIALPFYGTEVEKKALIDLLFSTGVKPKRIRVVDRPIADAVGAGVDLTEDLGVIIVDIGAATTDISIVSIGGVVESKTLKMGGDRLDESIINAVRRDYNFVIGKKTAEQIKKKLGCAVEPAVDETETMHAFGRDVLTGLPGSFEIDSYFVYHAIKEHIDIIVENIKAIHSHVSPEIAFDLEETGLILTGGGSGIKDLDKLINKAIRLKVRKCKDGSNAIVIGLGKIAEDPKLDYLAEDYLSFRAID